MEAHALLNTTHDRLKCCEHLLNGLAKTQILLPSLETTNLKSIIKQLYTEGLADLEIIKSITLLTGFSDICTENGSSSGFQGIFVFGESNVKWKFSTE